MSRRTNAAAEAAASAASEAARVLQARQQEARNEPRNEPKVESEVEPKDSKELKTEQRNQLPPRGNKVREQILEEIRVSRGEPKEAKEEPKEEPKEKVETSQEEPKEEAPPEPQEAATEAPKTVRVKVDGEEFDAPAEEVEASGGVAAYQREKAADKRLKAANEALAEARRAQASIEEWKKQQTHPQPKETDEQFIAERIDKIRFGTPEEAARAQLEILQRTQKTLDPNSIIEQAANKIKHDQAVAEFDREFQDIATNPIRLEAVVALRNRRIANINGPVNWNSFYRTIGNEVRSAFGGQHQPQKATPQTAGTTSQSPSDKEARKASITNLPTAASRAEAPKEDKPETREESLNRMRKSRGLPVH